MTIGFAALAAGIRPAGTQGTSGAAYAAGSAPTVDTLSGNGQDQGLAGLSGLSEGDFMKLFLAQLQNQDPTQPLDDKDMLAQLAQFSMIDTLQAVQKSLGGTQLAQSSSLIGKTVTGMATDGQPLTGVVDHIVQDSTGIALIVGNRAIVPSAVSVVTDTGA